MDWRSNLAGYVVRASCVALNSEYAAMNALTADKSRITKFKTEFVASVKRSASGTPISCSAICTANEARARREV